MSVIDFVSQKGKMMATEKGLIHVYYGDGKGKTTAGTGLCVRAAGCGKKVLIFQFLKDNSSGECRIFTEMPGVVLMEGMSDVKFTFNMTKDE